MAQGKSWMGWVAVLVAGGAAGVFLAPVVTPALARLARPTAKAALKAGRAVYQRGLETAAGLRETIEDVQAEIAAEAAAAAPAADHALHPLAPEAVVAEAPAAPPEQGPRRQPRAAVH